MKFGVFLPVSGKVVAGGGDVLAEAGQQAENLGFDSVWAAERIVQPWQMTTQYPYKADSQWTKFVPPDTPFLEPLTALTYLSAVTKKVELGVSVAVLPYRQPLHFARIFTSIDNLSKGRFILGAGVGWMVEEFKALGVDFHKRGAMGNEFLDILNKLWVAERPEYHGKHYDFDPVSVSPPPVRKPRFPVWTGGESPAAQKRAAKYADAWFSYFVKITAEELGNKFKEVQQISKDVGRDPSLGPVKLACCRPIDLLDTPVEQKAEDLEGTPDQLIAALKKFKDIGVEHMALQFIVGKYPERKKKIERFAKEVMPALK
ncbi:MAG: TIGR03619 family F420-dependent LLM class oxidoreductase [Acidobacteria bacterium]|nr:TIGR03619 family F420-dependent LLM class oxidoreductase [Acidobacteriota bacterium]